MLFNIPQFIDKEDKIVGFLTAKQLGWLFGAGTVLMVLWTILDTTGLIIAAIPVIGIFGALAFYQPNGQPLISFALSSISFMLNPKIYIWRRISEKETAKKTEKKRNDIIQVQKEINTDKIEELSRVLDHKQ
ncbi:MAG: PrgI family protein [Parcubacteria group bacterium]|jgi:hypothetical protein